MFVPPLETGNVPVTAAEVTSTAPVPSLVLVTDPNSNFPAVTFKSAISTSCNVLLTIESVVRFLRL
jgi:hypothetical protein